ncbi:hypothetical protein SBRCBS47491_000372 [Sporothrix bragantina]|uniref:Uncharacterized protein n=1 Tax=Sporothrix bragantina TaxID=671064 RepID=A0ABP0APR7_9PEZI
MATPVLAPLSNATTIVHFPRRQWTTLDSKWTLVLTATAQLIWDLPHTSNDASDGSSIFHSNKVASARVVELIRAGRLWIGQGGRSVELTVLPTLAGRPIVDSEDGNPLRERVQNVLLGWQPWEDELGLRVQNSHAGTVGTDDNDAGVLHITLNHPPSPHGLYAPRSDGGIPQTRLSCVSCQLNLDFNEDGFKLPRPLQTAQPQKTRATAKQKTKRSTKAKTKPAPPRKTPRLKPGPASRRQLRQQQEQKALELGNKLLDDGVAWHKATLLIETALHMLVGTAKAGSKPRVPGVRPADKVSLAGGAHGLLDVAPAVWSNNYFKSSAAPFTEADGGQLVDLCFDNLEAVFSRSPGDSDSWDCPLDETEDINENDALGGRKLDWGDIQEWAEPNEYFDDDDGLFQEIDGTWSPNDYGLEGRDADEDIETDKGMEAEEDDPYGDLSYDESGIAPWQDMQSELLIQRQDGDNLPTNYEEEYLDDEYFNEEELEFVDIDTMDFDEGVGLWRNDDDIIRDCC